MQISIEGITEEVVAGILTFLFTGGIVWIFRSSAMETGLSIYDRLLWTMTWAAFIVVVVFAIVEITIPAVITSLLMYLIGTVCVRVWWHKDK